MLSVCQWEMISKQDGRFDIKKMDKSLLNSECCLKQTI